MPWDVLFILLQNLAGATPIICMCVLALNLYADGELEQNLATWSMYCLLDTVLTVIAFVNKSSNWQLPLGCAAGTAVITLALVKRGKWNWGRTETFAVICSVVAAVTLFFSSAGIAGIISCAGLLVASTPMLSDTIQRPNRDFLWFWGFGVFAATCGLLTPFFSTWSWADLIFPVYGVIFNSAMCGLLLRKPSMQ